MEGRTVKALMDLVGRVLLPPIVAAVQEEVRAAMDRYLPLIVEVIVRTITESSIKLADKGIDKLTDIIPGELDDQIIDPIVRDVTARLGDLFRGLGR